MIKGVLILSCIAAFLFLVDRLLLRMERRGWIYWRKSQGSASRGGNALLEFQSILEPEKKHLIEVKREERPEMEIPGAPPDPDAPS